MNIRKSIDLNLDDIVIDEIAVFLQEGARATPEFSASCACTVHCGACSNFSCTPGCTSLGLTSDHSGVNED